MNIDKKELVQWLKDSVDELSLDFTGQYNFYTLDDSDNDLVIAMGYLQGFGEEDREDVIQAQDDKDYGLVVKICENPNNYAYIKFEDLNMPYSEEDAEVFDTEVSIKEDENFEALADWLIKTANKAEEVLDSGEMILSEGIEELEPEYDSRASFYKKAYVKTDENGDKVLYSYGTPVVQIKDGKVYLLAQSRGYLGFPASNTTLRHAKEFLKQNGFVADSLKQIEKDYEYKHCGGHFYEGCEKENLKESKKLNEATSNFGRPATGLPLLVFLSYDEVWDGYNILSDEEQEEMSEEEYFDNQDAVILTEEEIDELKSKIEKFNEETDRIADSLEDDDSRWTLEDIKLDVESGYYEGYYIETPSDKDFEYLRHNNDEKFAEEQIKRVKDFLYELKKEFGLTELSITGTFSNGETVYSKVESLKESKELKLSDVKEGQTFKVLDDVIYCDINEEGMFEDDDELLEEFIDNGFKLEGDLLIIPANTVLRYDMSQSVDVYSIVKTDYQFEVGEWSEEALNIKVEIIDTESLKESKEDELKELGLDTEVVIDIHQLVDNDIDLSGDDYNLDEVIADWLSDEYGFLVNNFKYEYDYNKDPDFVYVTDIDWDTED